jgi:protein gp37
MSDLFHDLVPVEFITEVFRSMAAAPQHTFQVLTKRPERMRDVLPAVYSQLNIDTREPVPNVWLGTSVENARFVWRVDCLREASAVIRFISAEPLLGPLAEDLDLTEIDWLIVGGESGWRHRPMHPKWVRDLRDRCQSADVAYFFKQWGGRTPKAGGRELDGRTWDQMPDAAGSVELAIS